MVKEQKTKMLKSCKSSKSLAKSGKLQVKKQKYKLKG